MENWLKMSAGNVNVNNYRKTQSSWNIQSVMPTVNGSRESHAESIKLPRLAQALKSLRSGLLSHSKSTCINADDVLYYANRDPAVSKSTDEPIETRYHSPSTSYELDESNCGSSYSRMNNDRQRTSHVNGLGRDTPSSSNFNQSADTEVRSQLNERNDSTSNGKLHALSSFRTGGIYGRNRTLAEIRQLYKSTPNFNTYNSKNSDIVDEYDDTDYNIDRYYFDVDKSVDGFIEASKPSSNFYIPYSPSEESDDSVFYCQRNCSTAAAQQTERKPTNSHLFPTTTSADGGRGSRIRLPYANDGVKQITSLQSMDNGLSVDHLPSQHSVYSTIDDRQIVKSSHKSEDNGTNSQVKMQPIGDVKRTTDSGYRSRRETPRLGQKNEKIADNNNGTDSSSSLIIDIVDKHCYAMLEELSKKENGIRHFAETVFDALEILSAKSDDKIEVRRRMARQVASLISRQIYRRRPDLFEPPKSSNDTTVSIPMTTVIDPRFINNPELADIHFQFRSTNRINGEENASSNSNETEDRILYAHKIVLANASSKFRDLVQLGTADHAICLEDISYDHFYIIIEYLYGSVISCLRRFRQLSTVSEQLAVIAATLSYSCYPLASACIKCLEQSTIQPENCIEILENSRKLKIKTDLQDGIRYIDKLNQLEAKCAECILKTLPTLIDNKKFAGQISQLRPQLQLRFVKALNDVRP